MSGIKFCTYVTRRKLKNVLKHSWRFLMDNCRWNTDTGSIAYETCKSGRTSIGSSCKKNDRRLCGTDFGIPMLFKHPNMQISNCVKRHVIFYQTARKHTSSLFVNSFHEKRPLVELDLNLDKRTAQKTKLKKNLSARGMDFDLDTFIEDYGLFKRLDKEKKRLEYERQAIGKEMSQLINKKKNMAPDNFSSAQQEILSRGKQVKQAHKDLLMSHSIWEEKVYLAALKLPNDLRSQTPESAPVILDSYGNLPDLSETRSHLDICSEHGLVKFSSVGPKAYYLNQSLATQEQLLLQFFSQHLRENNFHQLSCPEIFTTVVAEGCGIDYKNKHKIWTLKDIESEGDSLLDDFQHIQGVSLMSFVGYLTRHAVKTTDLPYRLFAQGRQYLPESDCSLPGLFGVSQSMKTVILSACPDRVLCMKEFTKLTAEVLHLYHRLKLPIRLVLIPAKDLLNCESIRAEIQIWAPSLKKYLKVGHIACVDDYASRRLMCHHSHDLTNYQHFQFLQMVYGEVLDVTRLLAIMIEHNKDDDMGLLVFPEFKGSEDAGGNLESESLFKLEDLLLSPEDILS